MPYPNWQGKTRLWTKEKVLEGLRLAAAEIKGPLPCLDKSYSKLKRGRLDWPPAIRILEFFGAIARGWIAAGISKNRVSFHNLSWTNEETEYLLENAGKIKLDDIGKNLGRTYSACRGQLRKLKTKARINEGTLSAAEISKYYNIPYHRIRTAIRSGEVPGKYDPVRNRYKVQPEDLTSEVIASLSNPRKTHKTWPIDRADYCRRYGLRRTVIDGKSVYVDGVQKTGCELTGVKKVDFTAVQK